MKQLLIVLFIFSACGDKDPILPPKEPFIPMTIYTPELYCGDGICDESIGEDTYNCEDCGYNPLTGCPDDGGYCGDGHCCLYEDMRNCFEDCSPIPINPKEGIFTPDWIDPIFGY